MSMEADQSNIELLPVADALPNELRRQILSSIHGTPRITIQGDAAPDLPPPDPGCIRRVARLVPNSKGKSVLRITYDDYDWWYLLTCKVFLEELRPFLPHNLHLDVRTNRYQVHHIPRAVQARYLRQIPVLTLVGRYPVYDTPFDGSQLTNLKTLYLQDHQYSSRIEQQFRCAFPPPSDLIARIQGSYDQGYIERGLRKLQTSKLNWWQADKPLWLHRIISAEQPRNFRFIVSQHVSIRFDDTAFLNPRGVRYVYLDIDFDATNGVQIGRRIRGPRGDSERELRDEEDILACFDYGA